MFIKGFILTVTECIDYYQAHIDATSMHMHSNTHKHAAHSSSLYATKPTLIWVISLADSGSDLRYWMTRGNHIEPRYDQIQRHPLMPCTKTQLDHVLTHNTGSQLVISAAHIPFERQHNPITNILFLTKTIHGCVTEFVFLCTHCMCISTRFCWISWCRYYYTGTNPTKGHAPILL